MQNKYSLNSLVFYGGHQYEVIAISSDGKYTIKSTSGEMTFNNVVEDVLNLPLTLPEIIKRLKLS